MNHSQISFLSSLKSQLCSTNQIIRINYQNVLPIYYTTIYYPIMNLVSALFSYEKNKYLIKEMEDRHINSHLNVPEE
jgi:hypothetical protein